MCGCSPGFICTIECPSVSAQKGVIGVTPLLPPELDEGRRQALGSPRSGKTLVALFALLGGFTMLILIETSIEIFFDEIRLGQIFFVEIRLGQIFFDEIRLGQIFFDEIRLGQISDCHGDFGHHGRLCNELA